MLSPRTIPQTKGWHAPWPATKPGRLGADRILHTLIATGSGNTKLVADIEDYYVLSPPSRWPGRPDPV
jgi:hypothetical protein